MMQTVTEIAAGRGEDGCSYCCHIALDTVGNCVFVAKVEGIEMYLLNKKSRRRLKSVACLL